MAAVANGTLGRRSDDAQVDVDVEADEARPSAFELVSQHGFSHALRPAFLHIVKRLAERYPEGIVPKIYQRFDEVYLAFDSLVQWHYMLTRGSTLGEAFYGLERNGDGKSSQRRIRISFLLSVILPYIKTKLDKLHDKMETDLVESGTNGGNQRTPSTSGSTTKAVLFELFTKYYTFFKAFLDLVNLLCLLRYSFGYSKSHSLLFLSLGLRLSYASPERGKLIQEKKSELFNPSSWSLTKFPTLILRSLGESVLFGVEIGSFFIQFLDWWTNDPRRERVVLTSLPVPPPLSSSDEHWVTLTPEEKNHCPLCRRRFKNPTALSTSGIVYCYGCISTYIKQHGSCPLTSIQSTKDNFIRIFA